MSDLKSIAKLWLDNDNEYIELKKKLLDIK